jgi:hypothetical protein
MSAEFIPLLAPAPSSKDPVSASHNVKILTQASPQSAFEPFIPDAAGPSASPENCSKPTITLERKGDVVSAIRIQCGCGSVIELTCLH